MKNKSGDYIAPTLDSTSAAADGLTIPDDLRISTIDAPGKTAYPITALTFLLVYADPCKAGHQAPTRPSALKAWLDYAVGDGQDVAGELQYAKLPAELHTKATRKVNALTCNGPPIRHLRWPTGTLARGGRALARPPLSRLPDRLLKWGLTGLAGAILALIAYFFVKLAIEANPVFQKYGVVNFVFSNEWVPSKQLYGALPLRRRHADHLGDRAAASASRSRSPPRCTSPSSRPSGPSSR